VLLAALVVAVGMLWSVRGPKGWVAALVVGGLGLAWSSADPAENSTWWRGRLVYEKVAGHLPYLPWSQIRREAVSGYRTYYQSEEAIQKSIQLLGEKMVDGRKLEQYQTPLGAIWIPAPGRELISWLVFELTVQQVYESAEVRLHPGDIVIDGGGHVGTFTRYALQRGAARVIVVEPEPLNIVCLEANLAPEIASGKVHLVKAGIWDEKTFLALADSNSNSAGHSFVREVSDSHKVNGMPLVPIDEIVQELGLDRVDFIKMDIEGAERRALAGARVTLARFGPRMAISSYHLRDDPAAIPAVVRQAQPRYHIAAKDFEVAGHGWITKVLFFQ
jgi:FkbM family methyltransferase